MTTQLQAVFLVALGWIVAAAAEPVQIDTANSTVTVEVKKSGILSAFGHDHEISAPLASGKIDSARHMVELHFRTADLKVVDRGISDKDRAEIQSTMIGPQVLDVRRYPEVLFRSTTVETAGAGAWKVQGELTLHGQTRPVESQVRDQSGRYVGTVRFRQTEFGMTPVKVAGGTVRVKDEIRIDFNIQTAR